MKKNYNDYLIIIQARMNSTRLKGKVLKNLFGEENIITILNKKLKNFNHVFAIPNGENDDVLCDFLQQKKILFYRGSEENVLDRFIETSKFYRRKKIIRICADNPFLDVNLLENLILIHKEHPDIDYLSYSYKNKPAIIYDHGIYAELTKREVLEKIMRKSNKKTYREHVTKYIYENSSEFKIKFIDIDGLINNFLPLRLTLDNQEDLYRIRCLCKKINPLNFSVNSINYNNELFELDDNLIKGELK